MRYIVLYAANCRACSGVARMIGDASIADLEARSFEDPEVAGWLTEAGLSTPDRPALMVLGDEGVHVLTGWAMRRRLAGVVGRRRSGTIVRLLAAEWRARLTKPATSGILSRRGVIGGILGGITGWAVSSGLANASPDTPGMKPAAPADAARVLKTATAQRAMTAFGPADQQVHEIRGGSQPVFVLIHPERDVYTFIDNSAAFDSRPTAVTVGAAPTAERALRYYTVDGLPLADLTVSDGQATATPVQPGSGEVVPDAVPALSTWQLQCFIGCIGRKSTPACVAVCVNCFYYAVGTAARLIACSNCVVCAGPNGVACLKECSIV
jgi:hypothetical protein